MLHMQWLIYSICKAASVGVYTAGPPAERLELLTCWQMAKDPLAQVSWHRGLEEGGEGLSGMR